MKQQPDIAAYSDPVWAAILYAPTMFFVAGVYSVGPASLMQVTPARMRGQAAAIYLFRDVNQVGDSIPIVTVVAHALAALLLWYGRAAFVRSREEAIALAPAGTL